MSEELMNQAMKWAELKNIELKEGLLELEKKHVHGIEVDPDEMAQAKTLASLSLDDLRREYIHQLSLDKDQTFNETDFLAFMQETGIGTSNEDLLSAIVNQRRTEYAKYYKIKLTDPYLNFILTQMIQDEIQIKRLRQEISLTDVSATLNDSAKQEKRKEIIDTIVKIHKSMFEIGKHLSQLREEAEELETKVKETEQASKKWGLRYQELLENYFTDPRIALANRIQRQKSEQYIRDILDFEDPIGPITEQPDIR